jgi:hypothetical protein
MSKVTISEEPVVQCGREKQAPPTIYMLLFFVIVMKKSMVGLLETTVKIFP